MPKIEIESLATDLQALPSQVSFVLGELGFFSSNGAVDVDDDSLEIVKDAVAEMVASKELAVAPGATPRDIATALNVGHVEVQKALMKAGTLAALTTALASEVAERIVGEFGYKVKWAEPPKPKAVEEAPKGRRRPIGTQPRAPIVTILGHVDHGKTSLLDYIRKTKVADKEFGGITQHIGAYQVDVHGKRITFLDTPGHAAFTAMRARGASVTDIAILVVAADDGVMPQTIEAINHAKSAEVPIIVALNKSDKPEANIAKVKQQLTQYEIVAEDFGGDTVMVPVSAKTGDGVDTLLELIQLQSDMMALKADAGGEVEGVVIEARLDKGRGAVATVLVESGTLKLGDVVLAGAAVGKIKAMLDFAGRQVKDAGPSAPVEILGLDRVPLAGDRIRVFLDDKEAKAEAARLKDETRTASFEDIGARVTLETLHDRLAEGGTKELRIIVKADVQGSVEAVRGLIEKIENDEVEVKILHAGVGTVNDNDVLLALTSGGIVVGFNTKAETTAVAEAERRKVQIRLYKVIYELIEDIEKAVIGMLEPKFEERYLGAVEIRVVFKLSKQGHVAGCYITDGKVLRNALCRVKRGDEIVYTGKIESLKHVKEDVRELAAGFECGIQFENWTGFKEGDLIEAYEIVQVS
jgi:translation initiation factor IF-2